MIRKQIDDTGIWFEEFIQAKTYQGLSEATIKDYKQAYDLFRKVSDGTLKKESIYQLIDYLNSRGSSKSINFYLTHLRAFANFCFQNNYVESFPIKLQKKQEEKIVFYTEEECQLLLQKPSPKANFREWRTYTMISFMLATGCRLGTLRNIKVEDIDLQNKEVTYRHLKTKEVAIIPLSYNIIYNLKTYLSMWEVNNFLFCDYNNEQMTENSVRMSITCYCNSRGVKSKGVHAFRHTFARLWILQGGDCFTLQRMLCHKDLAMTKRYCNLFSNDLHSKIDMYSPLDNLKNSNKVVKINKSK